MTEKELLAQLQVKYTTNPPEGMTFLVVQK